jgi:hypothetical protein
VAPIGESSAAGVAVMDEDCRFTGVGMPRGGDTTDVPPIAGGDQWEQADRGVFGGMQSSGPSGGRQPGGLK